MKTETGNTLRWYLAQHITTGKQRQLLFAWLSEQHVTPWTPLVTRYTPRSDRTQCCRKRVCQVFPGYFFLQADLSAQSVSSLRRHSAFVDFVSFGNGPCAVSQRVVEGLMTLYPDAPTPPPGTGRAGLTPPQYEHLILLEKNTHPVSRISMLLDLVKRADVYGFCH